MELFWQIAEFVVGAVKVVVITTACGAAALLIIGTFASRRFGAQHDADGEG